MTDTSTYLSGPGGSFIREHKLICKSVAVNDEGDYFVVCTRHYLKSVPFFPGTPHG